MRDPKDILNWRRVDDRITTSGQPSEAQLAAIQKLGVTTVINLGLHTHEKALPDEAASVAALGMRYVHIPVPFDAPTEQDYERFCSAMQDAGDQTIHVHCMVNARVSAFLYRYQRDALGATEAQSRAFMDSIWQPGGVWASFIGDEARADQPHAWAPKPPAD